MGNRSQFPSVRILIFVGAMAMAGLVFATPSDHSQPSSQQAQSPAPVPAATPTAPTQQPTPGAAATNIPAPPAPQRPGLNIVVLDPAHGGTDPGARGTGGVRESDIVLDLAIQVKQSLEAQGFQVLQTRTGNDSPSYDDRSAMANAQTGAVFISLHIASTGLPGTVRTYVMTDMPAGSSSSLIRWNQAQAPYVGLSHRLGDAVQSQLALSFHGSPNTSLTAGVRQLRTTAAPAIAVEISSVAVPDRRDLDKMMPGVADAIARGVAAFRPYYVTPQQAGGQP